MCTQLNKYKYFMQVWTWKVLANKLRIFLVAGKLEVGFIVCTDYCMKMRNTLSLRVNDPVLLGKVRYKLCRKG